MKDFRRDLRHNLTVAEAALWKLLKGRNVAGLQFRRQFSIDDYILDFYCPQLKLAIELDGNYHHFSGQRIADADRDKHLRDNYGIKTLRFENKTVFEHQWVITNSILQELELLGIKGQALSSPPKVGGVARSAEGVCPHSDSASGPDSQPPGFTHAPALTGTPSKLEGGRGRVSSGSPDSQPPGFTQPPGITHAPALTGTPSNLEGELGSLPDSPPQLGNQNDGY